MSKAGNVFRGLFKIIFTIAALAAAVIAILCMIAPFYRVAITAGDTELASISLTGFALAFGGDIQVAVGSLDPVAAGTLDISIGTLVAFIVLALGALLMLCNLFTWKPGKGLSGIGALFCIAAAVLFFLTIQINSDLSDVDQILNGYGSGLIKGGLGAGAITSGIFAAAAGVLGILASFFKRKEA